MTKEEYEALQKTSVVDKPELTTSDTAKQPTLEDIGAQAAAEQAANYKAPKKLYNTNNTKDDTKINNVDLGQFNSDKDTVLSTDEPKKTTIKQPTLEDTATQQADDSMNSHIPDSAQKQAAGISTAISADDIANTTAGKLDANPYVKQGREAAAKIDPIDNKEKEKFYTTQTTDDLKKQAIDKAIQSDDLSNIGLIYKGMDDATKAKWQAYVDAHTKKDSKLNNSAHQIADIANGDFTGSLDYSGRDNTKTGNDMGQKTQNSLDAIRQRDDGQTSSSTGTQTAAAQPKNNTAAQPEQKKGIDWSNLWNNFKGYMNTDMGGGGSRGYYLLDAIGKGAKNYGESWRGGAQTDTAYNANKAKQTGGNIENDLAASRIGKTTNATTQANLSRMSQLSGVDLSKPGAFSNLSGKQKADLKEGMKMFNNNGSSLTLGEYGQIFGGEIGKKLYDLFNK